MAFYLSPLVDVNEIDLSTTIPAVATSIGVIALRDTYKGAEKKQTFITDEADLIRAFGEPDDGSYEDVLSATGFLKYGNKLYATRVMPGDAEFSSLTVGIETSNDDLELDITASTEGLVTSVIIGTGGTGYSVGQYVSIDGNVALEQDSIVRISAVAAGVVTGVQLQSPGEGYVTGAGTATTYEVSGDALVLGITDVADDISFATPDQIVSAGGNDLTDTFVVGSVIRVVSDTGTNDGVYTVEAVVAGAITTEEITLTTETAVAAGEVQVNLINNFQFLPSEDPDDFGNDVDVTTLTDYFWFISQSRGVWGDNVRLAFLDKTTQADIKSGTLDNDYFGGVFSAFSQIDSDLDADTDFLVLVQVRDQRKSTFVTKETFNVSTDPNAISDTGAKRFVEDVINEQSNYIRVSADISSIEGDDFPNALVVDAWYTFSAGADGTGVAVDADIIEAYRLYENAEEIDVNIFIDSNKSETVKRDLIALCEERFDCLTVLDVPRTLVVNNKGSETTDLRDWRNSTFNENTSYAAVYGNWIEVYDKFNQKYRWIPVAGYVAGVYAKTDDVADAWWAPAGLNRAILTGVRRLAWNPKQGNRDILYSNGINPIVSFAGEGKVIWGQKTMLAKESAFNRVNVRRLFLVLEKAISTAAKYFLFEPNDPATRNQLRSMIEPFLRDVQSRRGIFDFKVVCDETNNTPERIDRNELWCNIFIKPTRTAEFIVLNFVATKTGASFDEAASAVG